MSSSLHRSLTRERTNKFLGLLRRDQPWPAVSALNPNETISTRNIHLDNPPPHRPEPAESTPNPASADSHTPSDLPFELLPVNNSGTHDALSGDIAALERPDHLESTPIHGKPARSKPKPHPDVYGEHQQNCGPELMSPKQDADEECRWQRQKEQC